MIAVFTGSVVNSTLSRLSASGGSGVRVMEVNGTLPVEPPCGKSAGQSLKACPSAFALARATNVKRSIKVITKYTTVSIKKATLRYIYVVEVAGEGLKFQGLF